MAVSPCGMYYLLVFSFFICVTLTPCVLVSGYEQNCKFNLKRDGRSEFYDLTSLSQPWKMKIGNDSQQNAVISLCGAAKTPCGRDGVCIAEKNGDNVTYRNMGNILQRPNKDFKSKRLTIRLTDGDQCTSSMNYSTEINFYCTEKFGEPLFQMFRNHTCQLVVNWGTSAACPLESAELQESCKPSGFSSFNLWPLRHKQYYTVKADKREYRINICDKVLDGVCNKSDDGSVCEMVPETNKIKAVLGLSSKQRFEYSERGLILTYKSKDKKVRTEIHFICNTSIPHGQPTLKLTNSSTVIVFEVETALACMTRPVDCIAYDSQGSRYDLQALTNNRRNWEVPDNRKGYENVKYYINVCRPLNPTTDYNCSEPSSAACQVNFNGTHVHNLGVLSSGPKLNNENQLKLYYSGGDRCQNGYRMSTEITFICSTNEKEPTFITETRECVFIFEWSTQSACPSKYSVGEECVVREPGSDHLFDLNLLYNPKIDYFMSTDTGTSFRLNLCKPLLEPCNGKKNISVCLEKNGTQFAVGELATKPMYEDGRVNFRLQGEGCKEGENSSTVYIIFMCNHQFVSSGVGPDLFPGGEDCTFYFLWQTNVSCLPYQEYPCKTVDDYGYEYDLSPLSNPSGNHIVHHKTQYGYVTFLLNLCRSIVHGHDAPCPPDSGVCLRNLTEPDRRKNYISLGDVVTWRDGKAIPNELTFKNGHLQITYNGGYLCGERSVNQMYISSTIHFYCDADKEPGPRFRKESGCNYEFEWGTNYACPKGSSDLSSLKEQQWNNCTAINPATKFRFDLNPLSKKEYSVTTANGKMFTVAVCGSSKKCGEGIGACLETDEGIKSIGRANSNLQFNPPSLLSLNYVGGSECAPGVKINTLIEFVCEEDPKKFGPFFVETTTNCTYIFFWLTDMVCEKKSSCVASNDTMEISLSPLISTTNNYKVTANGSDFFINVCRPLVPLEGLNCFGGSSACKAVAEPNGLWSHEESLGYGNIKPVIVDGGVALKYLSGSICPGKGFHLSSAFFFSCDPISDIGTPELQDFTEDCQYQFVWKTSVICSDYVKAVDSTSYILYNDQRHNESFNLRPLCKDKGHIVGDYALTCGADTMLSVTRNYEKKQISYGRLQKVIFSYAENVTKLLFSGGDSCFSDGEDSMLFDAEIRLRCIPEVEIGQPAILFMTNCSVVFDWGSKVGCGQNASAVIDEDKKANASSVVDKDKKANASSVVDKDKKADVSSVPRSHVSTAGVVIGILLTVVICLVLIYFRKPSNRSWCRNHLCNLLNRRHHGNFHYSRLEATDEASILLASHSDGVESDSDDELLRT